MELIRVFLNILRVLMRKLFVFLNLLFISVCSAEQVEYDDEQECMSCDTCKKKRAV